MMEKHRNTPYRKRHPHPSFLSSCHLFRWTPNTCEAQSRVRGRGDPPGLRSPSSTASQTPHAHRVSLRPLWRLPLCSSCGSVPSILSSDCPGHRDSHFGLSLPPTLTPRGISSDSLALNPVYVLVSPAWASSWTSCSDLAPGISVRHWKLQILELASRPRPNFVSVLQQPSRAEGQWWDPVPGMPSHSIWRRSAPASQLALGGQTQGPYRPHLSVSIMGLISVTTYWSVVSSRWGNSRSKHLCGGYKHNNPKSYQPEEPPKKNE